MLDGVVSVGSAPGCRTPSCPGGPVLDCPDVRGRRHRAGPRAVPYAGRPTPVPVVPVRAGRAAGLGERGGGRTVGGGPEHASGHHAGGERAQQERARAAPREVARVVEQLAGLAVLEVAAERADPVGDLAGQVGRPCPGGALALRHLLQVVAQGAQGLATACRAGWWPGRSPGW